MMLKPQAAILMNFHQVAVKETQHFTIFIGHPIHNREFQFQDTIINSRTFLFCTDHCIYRAVQQRRDHSSRQTITDSALNRCLYIHQCFVNLLQPNCTNRTGHSQPAQTAASAWAPGTSPPSPHPLRSPGHISPQHTIPWTSRQPVRPSSRRCRRSGEGIAAAMRQAHRAPAEASRVASPERLSLTPR